MENPAFSLVPEEPLPVTYLEGNVSRSTPVPTLYAIRFYCRALESALDTLLQNQELQQIFGEREDEKDKIHESLQRVMTRFQEYLMIDARR